MVKNKKRTVIKLNESDLHNLIKESVQRILNEIGDTYQGQYMLGRLAGKKSNAQRDYFPDTEVQKYAEQGSNGDDNYANDAFNDGFKNYKYDNGMNIVDDKYKNYKKQNRSTNKDIIGELKHLLQKQIDKFNSYRRDLPNDSNVLQQLLNVAKQVNDIYNNQYSNKIYELIENSVNGNYIHHDILRAHDLCDKLYRSHRR